MLPCSGLPVRRARSLPSLPHPVFPSSHACHRARPPRGLGAAAALIAVLAILPGCRSTPSPAPDAETARTIRLAGERGPRTPEGARLQATVLLTTRAIAGGRSAAPADAAVDDAVRAWLETALAGGMEAARDADAAGLAARLEPLGLALVEARIEDLALPGDERRRALAPTTDTRIMLIGLDAYDWDIADPLMKQGRLPVLQALVRRGTRARLESIVPILSPVVWTSMATGKRPQEHGILDFLGTDARGNAVPVTSNLRKVKAFWNVLSDAGVESGVVGWWATWPAEPVRGFLVSDRVAYQLFDLGDAELPRAGKVHPASAWTELEPLLVRPRDITPAEVDAFLSPSPQRPGAQDKELLEQFRAILAQARTYSAMSLHLHRARNPRVGAYYFEAPDTACHLFMPYAPPPLPEVDPGRQARYAAVVDRAYEYHDRIMGRLIEMAGPETVVMVVSDHGFRSGAARPSRDSRVETATAADWHERLGLFVAAGPGIRAGHEIAEASVLDIFPTMLALLGMPVAEDLAGRVLEAAFEPEFLAAHPVRTIPTFETGEAPSATAFATASPEDRAILEQLVAIGYVSPAALQAGAPGQAGGAGGEAAANAHNNLGTVLLQQGDFDAAVAEFRKVVAAAPSFTPGHVNLAHALIRLGDAPAAQAALEKALALDRSNARALSLLASLHLESGRAAEAERIARDAVAADARSAPAWYTLGQVLERAGRLDEARRAHARSAELDPDNAEPLNAVGNSLEAAGAYAEAAEWYRRALAVDPGHAAAYNNLALQLQRLGRLDEALSTYEEGRRRLPHSSVLLNNLATWHHLRAQQGLARAAAADASGNGTEAAAARGLALVEAGKAKALYAEAIEANALDASPINNLGALHGELGDAEEQRRLYRQAVELDPAYSDAWHNIGLWHLDRDQWAEAEAAFRRCLAGRDPSEQAHQLLASALVQQGRPRDARAVIEAALARRRSPGLLATLGSLHEQEGDRTRACQRYREALALAPAMADVRARMQAACGR